jgi:hypothetical protein
MYAIVTNTEEVDSDEIKKEVSGMIDEMKMEHIIKVFDKYSLDELEKLIP